MSQQVFVVDRATFFDGAWPQGFVPMRGAAARAFLQDAWARGRFVERAAAEATPAWKQWIPYGVLRCGTPGALEGAGVFTVQRTKGQSEARLHGSWSIGIGGHVEPIDGDLGASPAPDGAAFFQRALGRELAEELDFRAPVAGSARFLGLLNDDSTEVGRVHAGLVYVLDVPHPVAMARDLVHVREIAKMHGAFTHLVEFANLWQNPPQFESWSQMLVRAGIAGPIGGSGGSRAGDQTG